MFNIIWNKFENKIIYVIQSSYVGRIAMHVQKFEEINTKMLMGIVFE